jgi:hypothetical protein
MNLNQPDQLQLAFDSKTLDYIVNVLAQRPYGEVAPVLANISQQIAAQQSKGPLAGPQEALNGSGATEASPIQ